MNCPQCAGEFLCGCASCAPRHQAAGKVHSKPDGDYDTCGHCGHTMHMGEWLDESFRQYEEYKRQEGTNGDAHD